MDTTTRHTQRLHKGQRRGRSPRYFSSENVLELFYEAIAKGDNISLERVHIPRSDVFYARLAYFNATGDWITLDRMERAMYLEGMLDRRDVFEPDLKRDWEIEEDERARVAGTPEATGATERQT